MLRPNVHVSRTSECRSPPRLRNARPSSRTQDPWDTTHNAQVAQTDALIPSHGVRRRRSVRQCQATDFPELLKTLNVPILKYWWLNCGHVRHAASHSRPSSSAKADDPVIADVSDGKRRRLARGA